MVHIIPAFAMQAKQILMCRTGAAGHAAEKLLKRAALLLLLLCPAVAVPAVPAGREAEYRVGERRAVEISVCRDLSADFPGCKIVFSEYRILLRLQYYEISVLPQHGEIVVLVLHYRPLADFSIFRKVVSRHRDISRNAGKGEERRHHVNLAHQPHVSLLFRPGRRI